MVDIWYLVLQHSLQGQEFKSITAEQKKLGLILRGSRVYAK